MWELLFKHYSSNFNLLISNFIISQSSWPPTSVWCVTHTPHAHPHKLWAPRSASCKNWSQTTKLSSGPPSHHGFFPGMERVLFTVHRDMARVTQCMATISVSTCLRISVGFVFHLIMPICSIFTSTSSPEKLQSIVAQVQGSAQVTDECLHCSMVFCHSHLDKQEGFGFDFLPPPEMCPDGCAGDGCLRNQQNLSCLARAEPLVLPRAGKKQGRYKCSGWKWKVFLLCTQQELHHGVTAPGPSIRQPLPRARRCSSKLLAGRVWPSQEEPHLCPCRGEVGFHWANILLY